MLIANADEDAVDAIIVMATCSLISTHSISWRLWKLVDSENYTH